MPASHHTTHPSSVVWMPPCRPALPLSRMLVHLIHLSWELIQCQFRSGSDSSFSGGARRCQLPRRVEQLPPWTWTTTMKRSSSDTCRPGPQVWASLSTSDAEVWISAWGWTPPAAREWVFSRWCWRMCIHSQFSSVAADVMWTGDCQDEPSGWFRQLMPEPVFMDSCGLRMSLPPPLGSLEQPVGR